MRRNCGRRLTGGALGGLAVLGSALAVASPAGAATVGVPTGQLDETDFGRACGGSTCTYVNDRLSVGRTKAPASGTITRWRANIGEVGVGTGPVEVRLQVVRRTVNEAGVAADEFKAIRETASAFSEDEGVNTFQASLKIRKGDYIGLYALDTDVEVYGAEEEPGNRALIFDPPFVPGDPAQTPSDFLEQERIAFNATIKD
jgi:hypothetical protein